jgi:hypothetical protein
MIDRSQRLAGSHSRAYRRISWCSIIPSSAVLCVLPDGHSPKTATKLKNVLNVRFSLIFVSCFTGWAYSATETHRTSKGKKRKLFFRKFNSDLFSAIWNICTVFAVFIYWKRLKFVYNENRSLFITNHYLLKSKLIWSFDGFWLILLVFTPRLFASFFMWPQKVDGCGAVHGNGGVLAHCDPWISLTASDAEWKQKQKMVDAISRAILVNVLDYCGKN